MRSQEPAPATMRTCYIFPFPRLEPKVPRSYDCNTPAPASVLVQRPMSPRPDKQQQSPPCEDDKSPHLPTNGWPCKKRETCLTYVVSAVPSPPSPSRIAHKSEASYSRTTLTASTTHPCIHSLRSKRLPVRIPWHWSTDLSSPSPFWNIRASPQRSSC